MPKKRPQSITDHNTALVPLAKKLRKRGTKAEACLWKFVLSKNQMMGFHFRRQAPVLNFIADFLCKDLMLVIEVDGSVHDEPEVAKADAKRTLRLEAAGYAVVRFSNEEVLKHLDMVRTAIEDWVCENGVVGS